MFDICIEDTFLYIETIFEPFFELNMFIWILSMGLKKAFDMMNHKRFF